jgi:hypothetical protein
MDVARPFVEKLIDKKKGLVVYEDSSFAELGLGVAEISSLRAFLESTFKVQYGDEFLKSESLVSLFELSLLLKSFLPELDVDQRASQAAFATIGVPLWIAERSMFVLKEGLADEVELRYDTQKGVLTKDVVVFKSVIGGGNEDTTKSLIAFAFSEIVRRDARIGGVENVPQCAAFLAANPGWMPYVV